MSDVRLSDSFRAGEPDTIGDRLGRASRRMFATVRGRDVATLVADRDRYAAAAYRLEDKCDELRRQLADREAVIASLQPTWTPPVIEGAVR